MRKSLADQPAGVTYAPGDEVDFVIVGAGVVDRHHRSHDVPNLIMVDGSSFVTSGRGQPTMTIQALAFRAAEHAARMAKRGELS
ncbi:MAG: hypothetical protein JJD97_08215 [Gemmatimonadaceae bacterium]|nr:hypothetical protein [Gemmatimonadaceae bacterium]